MVNSTWLRRSLCLLLALVLCCTVCLRPLEAHAASLTADAVGVPAEFAVSAIAQALGVLPGEDTAYYDLLIDDLLDSLDSFFCDVKDVAFKCLEMYCYGGVLFAPIGLVQATLDAIISKSVLSKKYEAEVPVGSPDIIATILGSAESRYASKYPFYFLASGDDSYGNYCLYYLKSLPTVSVSGSYINYTFSYSGYQYYKKSTGATYGAFVDYEDKYGDPYTVTKQKTEESLVTYPVWMGAFKPAYSSPFYTVGNFADTLDDEKYLPWQQSGIGITIPGSDEEDALPVGIPPGISSDWGQDKGQSGEIGIEDDAIIDLSESIPVTRPGDYADTDTGTDTDTDTGTTAGVSSGTIASGISAWWANVVSEIRTFFADLGTIIVNTEQAIIETISTSINELLSAVLGVPITIEDILVAIFVPSADYLTAKVDFLVSRFPFIGSIIETGEFIRDSVSGSSGPPAIYVNLGLAPSGIYGSQRVLLTDFAWYEQYKPTVDSVLSAALWAFFGWRVFMRLPGIISGESGYIGEMAAHREKMEKIRSGPPGKK